MKWTTMAEETLVVADELSVKERLARLGIPLEVLVRAAQWGFAERALALPYDPVTAAGTDAWRYTVRSIRMDLEGPEWRMDDPQNLPLLINDQRGINLTVSSGDDATGNPYKTPQSKNPKGTLLEEAVARNVRQGDLFPELLTEAQRKFSDTANYPTWVYLVFITDEEIRAELSLPNSYGENNRLDGWACRIIITVPLPDEAVRGGREEDEGPEILPNVTPRI